MDPYGGPHGQRVVAAHNPHLTSQWFADHGFAVIVADGRGTPGRSPAWEKEIHHDFTLSLDDQVEALQDLAQRYPLDLSRVAIRGWSFGGWLAGLAVLRRPDVFHAGIAGAPVTDWHLYDTHYTERYLGAPAEHPESYAGSSLVTADGLSSPAEPHRPLMVVHGLADDNVVVAHALRLSSALLAARPPARGPAAVRGHAHHPAGTGRGEPAPPPGRLPEALPGHQRPVLTTTTGRDDIAPRPVYGTRTAVRCSA